MFFVVCAAPSIVVASVLLIVVAAAPSIVVASVLPRRFIVVVACPALSDVLCCMRGAFDCRRRGIVPFVVCAASLIVVAARSSSVSFVAGAAPSLLPLLSDPSSQARRLRC